MKIISGSLKGRVIKGYDIIGTRPTMDRIKESLFAMIQNYIHDSVVLDLFSGTGNYGIEAISNGARFVYFNDHNKKCITFIKKKLEEFQIIEKAFITNNDYIVALEYYKKNNIQFDLVFLDPPYKDLIINKVINYIVENKLLKDKALIICEVLQIEELKREHITLFKERKYGDKTILIYQYHDDE